MKRIAIVISLLVIGGCTRTAAPTDTGAETPVQPVATNLGASENNTAKPPEQTTASNHGQTNSGTPAATPGNPPQDVRGWLARLGSKDRKELQSATTHFDALGDEARAIYFAHVGDRSPEVRRGAIYGLYSKFDGEDTAIVTALLAGLKDEDSGVRHIALEAASRKQDGVPQAEFVAAIPNLTRLLDPKNEPDAQVRRKVAGILALRTASRPALPALNESARSDPDYAVRSASLHAIYDIAGSADDALPAPMHALANDPDPRLRSVSAKRLGKYGKAAAPAVDGLIAALADTGVPQRAASDPLRGKDEPVCVVAADALTRIGKPAVAPLAQQLAAENRTVRILAIRTLGNIGPAAKEAIPALQKKVASPDADESTAAKAALVKIGAK